MDIYQTVTQTAEGIYKEKGSKFIAFLYPVQSEEEIKDLLKCLKDQYYDARHHCYAYRLGAEGERWRAVDDGEPSSTAGKPILSQLLSANITNVCIFVIRYFGGIKLGVSGLINAYKLAAADAIANATIVEKEDQTQFCLYFDYGVMNDIMKIIKDQQITVHKQEFDLSCMIHLAIRKSKWLEVKNSLLKIESTRIDID